MKAPGRCPGAFARCMQASSGTAFYISGKVSLIYKEQAPQWGACKVKE